MEINFNKSAWFRKYVPTNLDEYLFGSKEYKTFVMKWLQQGFIDGNLLLSGEPGTGKTSLINILVSNLIKNKEGNYKRINARKISDLDAESAWIEKKPVNCQKKIIVIEEFDKTSAQFRGALKDEILERYQEINTFICTTNHINKIDDALKRRFSYKFTFSNSFEYIDIFNKLQFILNNEKIEFDENDLKTFILTNKKNISDLITDLQIMTSDGVLKLDKGVYENIKTDSESVVDLTLKIFKKTMGSNGNEKEVIKSYPDQSIIKDEWCKIVELIYFNESIDYDEIFKLLSQSIRYIPLFEIVNDYYIKLENSKLLYINYIAFIASCLKIL